MAVSLSKGGNVSLTKEAPGMTRIVLGLGWDARVTDGQAFDLDASAFLVGEDGKVSNDANFIFYGNKNANDGSVIHNGDNLTGDGDGDDETISIDLTKIATDVKKVVVSVTIHDAESRKQSFGQVSNGYVRVLNADTQAEVARYDLSEDASSETAMIFGELYRHNEEWKFKAVGQGFEGGLKPLALAHGVNIG